MNWSEVRLSEILVLRIERQNINLGVRSGVSNHELEKITAVLENFYLRIIVTGAEFRSSGYSSVPRNDGINPGRRAVRTSPILAKQRNPDLRRHG